MSDIQEQLNPVEKIIEANLQAETALNQENPNVELAQAWAQIASNWSSIVDPRSPEVRKLTRPQNRRAGG